MHLPPAARASGSMPPKKIIVNADDFGLTESVNQAIIEVFNRGNLNSTTLMVNMPGTAHAVGQARANPSLRVGLHFCITEGAALSGRSTLTDAAGNFLDRPGLFNRILKRKVARADIATEFASQLEKFQSFGIPLSHVDSHQHVHTNPRVFEAVLPLVRQAGLPMRIVYPPLHHELLWSRPGKYFKQLVLNGVGRSQKRKFGGKSNDCLVSIHDLAGLEGVTAAIYEELVRRTPGRKVIELMVHPFILGKDLLDLYRSAAEDQLRFLKLCELEFRLLCGDRVIPEDGYSIIGYGDA